MRLNDNEKEVLRFLGSEFSVEAGFCCFDLIQSNTQLDRKTVRRACRSLKRKGLTKFAIGLWTEDGEPRGSGYAATREGREILSCAD